MPHESKYKMLWPLSEKRQSEYKDVNENNRDLMEWTELTLPAVASPCLRATPPLKKCRLAFHRETDWSKIRVPIISPIVSYIYEASICKNCLQTASPDLYRDFAPGSLWGTSVPRPPGLQPQIEKKS